MRTKNTNTRTLLTGQRPQPWRSVSRGCSAWLSPSAGMTSRLGCRVPLRSGRPENFLPNGWRGLPQFLWRGPPARFYQLFFFGEGSLTKIDVLKKVGTLILTSLLEDLAIFCGLKGKARGFHLLQNYYYYYVPPVGFEVGIDFTTGHVTAHPFLRAAPSKGLKLKHGSMGLCGTKNHCHVSS